MYTSRVLMQDTPVYMTFRAVILCIICPDGQERGGGGGGLRTIGFKIIRSKSNYITLYRSLWMHNQAETEKERSQGTSIQQNSMHYLPRRGSESNRFQIN